jgi:hypothetical protein
VRRGPAGIIGVAPADSHATFIAAPNARRRSDER